MPQTLLRDYRVLISLAILRHLRERLSESANLSLLSGEQLLPSIAIDALRSASFDALKSDLEKALLAVGDERLERSLQAIFHSVEPEPQISLDYDGKSDRVNRMA